MADKSWWDETATTTARKWLSEPVDVSSKKPDGPLLETGPRKYQILREHLEDMALSRRRSGVGPYTALKDVVLREFAMFRRKIEHECPSCKDCDKADFSYSDDRWADRMLFSASCKTKSCTARVPALDTMTSEDFIREYTISFDGAPRPSISGRSPGAKYDDKFDALARSAAMKKEKVDRFFGGSGAEAYVPKLDKIHLPSAADIPRTSTDDAW